MDRKGAVLIGRRSWEVFYRPDKVFLVVSLLLTFVSMACCEGSPGDKLKKKQEERRDGARKHIKEGMDKGF